MKDTQRKNVDASKSSRWIQLLRSRRASVALLTLFVCIAWAKPMGLLLWARIRILTNLPRTAIADDPLKAPETAPEPPLLETGLEAWSESKLDPFRIDPQRFPNPTPQPPTTEIAPVVEKPVVISVDVEDREAFESARRAAERFRLQTAGRGLSTAVIDGRPYRVGDTIEREGVRFTLLEVRDGGAVLESGDGQFELTLRGNVTATRKSGGGT